LCRWRQIKDGGFDIPLQAVYRDDARPARGQQPHGRAADHACGAGDNGNPAVEADAIGHGGVPLFFSFFRRCSLPSVSWRTLVRRI
jgi:hypothetical protein